MFRSLGRFVLLVNDYDEALQFYTEKLGFDVIVDMQSDQQRFVHVGLPGQSELGIWFLGASNDEQRSLVGKQTDGEPCFVLYTNECRQTYEILRERGIHFYGPPQEGEQEIVAHFEDLYGNEIVLVELKPL